jgi:hypothetical protein
VFEVIVKRRHDSFEIITVIQSQKSAAHESADLAIVKLDCETAKASPPSRPATPHSLC